MRYSESEAAWRGVLDDLVARGLRDPEFLIIDGAAGLEKALGTLWPAVPTQRCTVHKHRNLLAHAPDTLHEEISADYTDMIYAKTAKEIETRRRSFIRKWRLKCRAVADSRRVRRALGALFRGAVSKDTVSRTWRKVQTDWEAWFPPLAGGGECRPPDPGRNGGAGATRPPRDVGLAARGAGHPPGRSEGSVGGEKHGWGERGGLADCVG